MRKFGIQFLDKGFDTSSKASGFFQKTGKQYDLIKEVLKKFQVGYIERNLDNLDAFMDELFIKGENGVILGTGTGELFLGYEQAKILVGDDWKYWGDAIIDCENAQIDFEDEVAWFVAEGSVKYTFEDTPERYDSYINFIKKKSEDPELTPKQKLAFINWALALTYHQRPEKKREYLLPMRLTGVLLKDKDMWKFTHLHFSLPRGNFPDERFENSNDHLVSYNNQNEIAEKYLNNQLTEDLETLLKGMQIDLIGQKDLSKERVTEYFVKGSNPYIIAPENNRYKGIDQIKGFFDTTKESKLLLDLEHSIVSKADDVIWVTICGKLNQTITEEELSSRVLNDLGSLFETDLSSKEKIFSAHRSIAFALKESSTGASYTCPIRLTAVILKQNNKLVFQNIHFSYPSYWIFEGKIDSI